MSFNENVTFIVHILWHQKMNEIREDSEDVKGSGGGRGERMFFPLCFQYSYPSLNLRFREDCEKQASKSKLPFFLYETGLREWENGVNEIHQSQWIQAHLKVLEYTFYISKLYRIRHQLGPTILLHWEWGVDLHSCLSGRKKHQDTSHPRRHRLPFPSPVNMTVELPALETHFWDLELGPSLTLSRT